MDKTPGRNDPCHCGSGLKYKKCHADSDREAAGSPRLRLLSNAPEPARRRMLNLPPAEQLNRAWEVDIAPVPASFADDPAARPAAILVAAPPFVLSSEMVNRPPAEPEALAELLAGEIQKAVESTGVKPEHIAIRHAVLAEPLARVLKAQNIPVLVADVLPGVEDALRNLLGHVFGGIVPLHLLRSQPETWAGWGMPTDRVARLFSAAANFFRAMPWKIVVDEFPIHVKRPDGHEWTAIIMGAAGEQSGLAFYEDSEDLERMQRAQSAEPSTAMMGIKGLTVSLLFNTRSELPKPMRAEIKQQGWDVAAPNAFPTLVVLNSPGGGIREAHFDDLIAALESVPRFVTFYQSIIDNVGPETSELTWTDPDNHVTCRMSFKNGYFDYDQTGDDEFDYDEFEDEQFATLGVLPVPLQPSGPIGTGATPFATLTQNVAAKSVNRTLLRYRAWLRNPANDSPPPASLVRTYADYARMLLERCAFASRKPVTAITEYEVREFLYDWYPRVVRDTERGALEMLASLKTFFEFLEAREHVSCPWVRSILADSDTFKARWASFPRGHFWDAEVQQWQNVLMQDLSARLLILVNSPAGGVEWGGMPGSVEYTLNREAHQLWLAWRDEALGMGMPARAALEFILARQHAWATTANALCASTTPARAIAKEQKTARRAQPMT